MNCQKCGTEIPEGANLCPNCDRTPAVPTVEIPEKKENVVLGILGALVGAILGGASIVLLSQLGYVASISGLILAFCTLKGYELLGKKLSTAGIIISIILMLVTPYIADRLSWAILVIKELGYFSLGEAFACIPLLLEDSVIAMSDYLKNLGMIYLFVVIGGVGTIINAFKKSK